MSLPKKLQLRIEKLASHPDKDIRADGMFITTLKLYTDLVCAMEALETINGFSEYAQCYRNGIKVNPTAIDQLDNAKRIAREALTTLKEKYGD